jgi:hypothetical protein
MINPQSRAAPSTRARKSDAPVLAIDGLLQSKVQPLGDYQRRSTSSIQGGK